MNNAPAIIVTLTSWDAAGLCMGDDLVMVRATPTMTITDMKLAAYRIAFNADAQVGDLYSAEDSGRLSISWKSA